jgi:DNA-binding Xre family transcriptional regulator
MGSTEKIKIMLIKKKMTISDLAERTGQSSQNLSNKLAADNFRENELRKIANAMNCDYDGVFISRDTGETY